LTVTFYTFKLIVCIFRLYLGGLTHTHTHTLLEKNTKLNIKSHSNHDTAK